MKERSKTSVISARRRRSRGNQQEVMCAFGNLRMAPRKLRKTLGAVKGIKIICMKLFTSTSYSRFE